MPFPSSRTIEAIDVVVGDVFSGVNDSSVGASVVVLIKTVVLVGAFVVVVGVVVVGAFVVVVGIVVVDGGVSSTANLTGDAVAERWVSVASICAPTTQVPALRTVTDPVSESMAHTEIVAE